VKMRISGYNAPLKISRLRPRFPPAGHISQDVGDRTLKCVIIAAGRGSRLAGRAECKPLCPVNGRPLIEWVIESAGRAGLTDFVVVTGFARERVEGHLEALARAQGISISPVFNKDWEKENGISVSQARGIAGERFVLSMSDHIVEPGILTRLVAQPVEPGEVVLAVDFNVRDNPSVDIADVTKVMTEGGRIVRIGKDIEAYNAFDTGVFLCTSGIFEALEESRERGDASLTGGMRVLAERRKARVMDIEGGFWIDIDEGRSLDEAQRLLAHRG
jgi:1L-myo-inositol 1-phosphate cytidylyltransferase